MLAASVAFGETPAFEVASIKPAGAPDPAKLMAGKMRIGMTIDQGRVDIGFFSLTDLIRTAYKVKPYQVTGPSWMTTERFDIQAKLPEGATKEQVPEMLQALLADRFKLTMHRESKEQNTYALVVAKGGPKLKDSLPDVDAPPPDEAKAKADGGITIGTPDGQMRVNRTGGGMSVTGGPGGPMKMTMGPAGMHMEAAKMTMTAFAEMLTPFVDRPVVDMTELKGTYQVALDLSMEDMRSVARMAGAMMPGMGGEPPRAAPADAATDPSGGTIFSTVQQLGLKLEPRKAPIEHIVVDHLEKAPTDN
jgi:uncharacterized protein (TIGR03435 family)